MPKAPKKKEALSQEERLAALRECVGEIKVKVLYECPAVPYIYATLEEFLAALCKKFDLTEEEGEYFTDYVSDDIDEKVSSLGAEVADLLECAVDQFVEEEMEEEPEEKHATV